MKRWMASLALLVMLGTLSGDAWARAGRGGSFGGRGTRSFSAPARPLPGPINPSRPAQSPYQQPGPSQRSGWLGGLGGALGGFLLGGLLGHLLFGGLRGGFGGFGLLELLIVAGLAYFAFSMLRRRQQPLPESSSSARTGAAGSPWTRYDPPSGSSSTATLEAPPVESDRDRGLSHIRQMDPAIDVQSIESAASDIFFKVQAAWMVRDVTSVRDLLTPEMQGILEGQCRELRADGKINRLENIAVRSVDVTEAWQESGQDYVTVRFLANVLDYTVDEGTNQVVEGSRTEPVKFEEYWTFARPVGPSPWKLSAIQQGG